MARPRSEAARAKALGAATDLVLTAGVRGFSVDEVVRRSGVAKTTIYRHFSSGNELMLAALSCTIAPFSTPDTGSLRSDLIEFANETLPMIADPLLRPVMLEILAAAARDDELRELHAAVVREKMTPLRVIYERAQERGEADPALDFDRAFDLIEGPFMARWLMRPDMLQMLDVAALVDRIVVGLAAKTN